MFLNFSISSPSCALNLLPTLIKVSLPFWTIEVANNFCISGFLLSWIIPSNDACNASLFLSMKYFWNTFHYFKRTPGNKFFSYCLVANCTREMSNQQSFIISQTSMYFQFRWSRQAESVFFWPGFVYWFSEMSIGWFWKLRFFIQDRQDTITFTFD